MSPAPVTTSQQEPYDAFWGARYAIVEDPDGNAVGLMSPIDPDRQRPTLDVERVPPSPPTTFWRSVSPEGTEDQRFGDGAAGQSMSTFQPR